MNDEEGSFLSPPSFRAAGAALGGFLARLETPVSLIGGGGMVSVFIGAIGVEGAVLVGDKGGVETGVEEVGVEEVGDRDWIGHFCKSKAGNSTFKRDDR